MWGYLTCHGICHNFTWICFWVRNVTPQNIVNFILFNLKTNLILKKYWVYSDYALISFNIRIKPHDLHPFMSIAPKQMKKTAQQSNRKWIYKKKHIFKGKFYPGEFFFSPSLVITAYPCLHITICSINSLYRKLNDSILNKPVKWFSTLWWKVLLLWEETAATAKVKPFTA